MRRFYLKSLLAAAVIISSSTAAMAVFPGLNVGIGGGIVKSAGTHRFYDKNGTSSTQGIIGVGYLGGGSLGYVIGVGTVSKIILGFDVSAYMMGGSIQQTLSIPTSTVLTGPQGNVNISHSSSFGAGLIGGMMLNPKISAFVRLGFESAKFKLDYNDLKFGTEAKFVKNLTTSAFVPGLGAAMAFSPNFYASVTYEFPIYKKINVRSGQDTIAGAQVGFTYRPVEHRIIAKLGLRFGG